ncbi:hypothetical protein F0U60_53575 [Archangium minus]|uniref:Lipoprotein n=1 Tax=Archangium minus TaxID=83450 RepID=A0ABY9X989_9BACT|nr:hypothetical protein F0U60_53575 [Archangium minus]
MRFRACLVLLLLASACASAPAPQSMPRPYAFASAPTSGPRIRLVSSPMEPTPERSWIGKPDLDKARALLFRARQDIEPRQWEQLNRKLTAAERAFERFSRAAKASGQAAEVARGAEGVAQAGRARTLAEFLPRVGPLLVGLVLLYPSSTAGPDIDRRPEWLDAQREYEARLLDVAEESRRLMEEFEGQEAEEVVPDFDSDPVAAVTAPTSWRTETNPATGKPYTSVEEYDRIPRHANQTCKNSLLDTLQAEKDKLSASVPPFNPKAPNSKQMDKAPCSAIRLRIEALEKIVDKRWEIQKKCFGGKPDEGHKKIMLQLERAITKAEKLEKENCAPGHPMADK